MGPADMLYRTALGESDDQSTTWNCGYWCFYQGYDLFGTEDSRNCVCGHNLY